MAPLNPVHTAVLFDRQTVEGIMSDTRDTLSRNVPVPEIREMEDLLTATVQVQLDLLDQAAAVVNDGPGAQVGGEIRLCVAVCRGLEWRLLVGEGATPPCSSSSSHRLLKRMFTDVRLRNKICMLPQQEGAN
jgi:hypothetical protein